ncbi:MAG: TetR family transcriptional regulator [Proteobacteria bacterium]|nr:MAG: TetR family transcriptional regulator [Pseudomonadota bacterium]
MRRSKVAAAETRRRIVETAAAEFRRNGIRSTGLSDVMATAGLTHGGFYRHFASKDQLIAEACTAAMQSPDAMAEAWARRAAGKKTLKVILKSYLSTDHRDNVADGCPFAGLGSELARSDAKTRAAATSGFLKVVDVLARQYRQANPEGAKARALVAAAAMIGAVTMSRIVTDPKLSAALLRSAKQHLARI